MASLGNLVRLVPLEPEQLPYHPSLEKFTNRAHQASQSRNISGGGESGKSSSTHTDHTTDRNDRPNIRNFVKEVLDEALAFIEDALPNTFQQFSEKSSSPAHGKVQLFRREISGDTLSSVPWTDSKVSRQVPEEIRKTGETWFARKSCHSNKQNEGTADFGEFDRSLRVHHSQNEERYTPDVFDAFNVLEWTVDEGAPNGEESIGRYSDITMSVYEMCHKLPLPLSPRVFPVLVITAKTGQDELVVAQIPVNIQSLQAAFYSNRRNEHQADTSLKRKRMVIGIYTSIERCILQTETEVVWSMATASDAKGSLPMWTQKMGVPGAVTKDVGLVVGWIMKQRTLKATSSSEQ